MNIKLNSAIYGSLFKEIETQKVTAGASQEQEIEKVKNISVTSIQEETSNIKNTNDIFGYLKKSEKALNQISEILKNPEKNSDTLNSISSIVESSTYKDKNIFESFRQNSSGSSLNLKEKIDSLIGQNDMENLSKLVDEQTKTTQTQLSEIKKELLANSNSLDRRISTDIETIKKDIEAMSPVTDINSQEHLRSKLKALLG